MLKRRARGALEQAPEKRTVGRRTESRGSDIPEEPDHSKIIANVQYLWFWGR